MTAPRLFATLVVALLAVPPAEAVKRYMFVTSVGGTGNLSSWADAGGYTGLAAGDAICRARAELGGLPNPTTYRAWLSDGGDDAYCRMHNLTGKRAANCGQATLPAAAGPWWRTDGEPFGAGLPELLAPVDRVLTAPAYTEFGFPNVSAVTWTATTDLGEWDGTSACSSWGSASATETAALGAAYRTSAHWTAFSTSPCNFSERQLFCFEPGAGDPLPTFPTSTKLAFLTSVFGTGNLGSWLAAGGATGLAAGDAICRTLAAAAGVRQSDAFLAWLSVPGTNAIDRLLYDGPWMRLDGIRLAASKVDLTDGILHSSLHITETGTVRSNWAVWTGTAASGWASGESCAGWASSSSGQLGGIGISNSVNDQWTYLGAAGCDFSDAFLYCLQDLPLLFFDGFDSGTTAAWKRAP